MVDLDRSYDVESAAEAARLTGLDMIAIAEMVDTKKFDWVVAAHLIKASRDRLEPFMEVPRPDPSPDRTNASVEWVNAVAIRMARSLADLFIRLESVVESGDRLQFRQWERDLLAQITLAVIDLRDLSAAPNIEDALLPEPQFGRIVNPNPTDAS